MKYFNTILIASILSAFLAEIGASESGDFMELVHEKARIKADIEETKIKPTAGQLIASVPVKPTQTPKEAVIGPTETATVSPPASKPKKKEEKVDESVDEEPKKNGSSSKDPKKKDKKKISGTSDSTDSEDYNKSKNDGSDELPKRLFRPRFRAENSADSIKHSSVIVALAVSLIGFYFI